MAGAGGAWKVAYADFVTAMMAFFLVMWITAQNPKVKQSVAQYFNEPPTIKDRFRPGTQRGRKGSPAVGVFQTGLGPGNGLAMADRDAEAQPNPKGVAAVLPPRMFFFRDAAKTRTTGTIVQFPAGSAELEAEGRERLKAIAPLLSRLPTKVEIRSHLPRHILPDDEADVWRFSHARCVATMKYLEELGIAPNRFRLTQAADFETYSTGTELAALNSDSYVEVFAIDEFMRQP